MELRWLHDFLAIAETRNFTRAAELRHTSQAALSRRIQQLEAWIGARLIDRAVYPSCLTAQGERFVTQAREMLRLASESRDEALKGECPSSDFLRIALPLTLAIHLLPGWWRGWFADRAAPGCDTLPSNLHDAVTALVSDAADLLLCYSNPQWPIQLEAERFESRLLMQDSFRPYAAPSLRGKGGATGPATAWQPAGWKILSYAEGTYLGQLMRRIFEAQGAAAPEPPVFRCDMAEVLCQMAVEGGGVAWLPGCVARQAVARGELVALGDARWARELSYAAYRNPENRNPALRQVWQALPNGLNPARA